MGQQLVELRSRVGAHHQVVEVEGRGDQGGQSLEVVFGLTATGLPQGLGIDPPARPVGLPPSLGGGGVDGALGEAEPTGELVGQAPDRRPGLVLIEAGDSAQDRDPVPAALGG